MAVLFASGVACGYGGRPVVEGFEARLSRGELLFLLGPIGSGKTTLLRCLGGLSRPLRGTVLVEGKPIHRLAPRERARLVAYVPQHPPRSGLRVYEAVLLGRYPYRRALGPDPRGRGVAEGVLERLGLWELRERRLCELSGGQLQKAMLARALAQEPRLLLLDEPASSLDPRSRLEVMRLLRRVAEEGVAAVIACHSLDLAARFADKVVMLGGGRVVVSGRVGEVLTPENIERTYGLRVEILWRRGRPVVVPLD